MLGGAPALAFLPSFLVPIAARLGLAPARPGGGASLLADGFRARFVEPTLPPLERTPEPGGEPAQAFLVRTPQQTPQARQRTPPRPLHWWEYPDTSAERVIALGEGVDPPLDRRHPVATHASRLMLHILDPQQDMRLDDPPICRGRIERGLFAFQAQQAYYHMCFAFAWHPHRWEGAGGVAEHFGKHLKRAPRYRWCLLSADGEADGREHKRTFYFLPKPALALGKKSPKRTPRQGGTRTPKRTPNRTPQRARLGKGSRRRAA